jgi:hypothetical protein
MTYFQFQKKYQAIFSIKNFIQENNSKNTEFLKILSDFSVWYTHSPLCSLFLLYISWLIKCSYLLFIEKIHL